MNRIQWMTGLQKVEMFTWIRDNVTWNQRNLNKWNKIEAMCNEMPHMTLFMDWLWLCAKAFSMPSIWQIMNELQRTV